MQYRWDPLVVRDAGPKGKGVFAARPIKAGLLIPYLGKLVTEDAEQDDHVIRHEHAEFAVDANPDTEECEHDYCVAGRINEASEGTSELYNCVYVPAFDNEDVIPVNMPDYKQTTRREDMSRDNTPFVLVACDLNAGDELLVCYNGLDDDEHGYARNGYTPKQHQLQAGRTNAKNEQQMLETWRQFKEATTLRLTFPVDA